MRPVCPFLLAQLVLTTALSVSAETDPPLLTSRTLAPELLVLLPSSLPDLSIAERERQVESWLRDYEGWKAWFARWHNRREPGLLAGRARPRKERPAPPAWLAHTCEHLLDPEGPLAEGCRAWREWARADFFAEVIAQRRDEERDDREAPRKSVWWQHVHLDALWPMAQSGSSVFGVLGMHVTLPLTPRTSVFVAPGAILIRLPAGSGRRRWSTAADWGFSYRLFDFAMPRSGRPGTIHLNVARVWLLGARPQTMSGDVYLVGLSLTLAPRPRSMIAR